MDEILAYFISFRHQSFPKEIDPVIIGHIHSLGHKKRAQLRHALFEASHQNSIDNGQSGLKWIQYCFELIDKYSFSYHKVFFSPGNSIKKSITNLLTQAQESVDLCVFTITDAALGRQIKKCHRRGVKVRIITDDEKTIAKGSEVFKLEALGIPIKIDHSHYHMHNKFGIIDKRVAITGSFNWTYTASIHNQENLLATSNYQIVKQYRTEFERLWQEMYTL